MAFLFLLQVLALTVAAQFVTPPDDLTETIGYAGVPVRYKQVPVGICELDPNVKSFSGYADVAEDQHIFWWFFEARNGDPENAPLTVWINGGPGRFDTGGEAGVGCIRILIGLPGSSSMIGLFAELGPCGVDYFGEVYNNPHSWTNVSNVLFIDQPSQVGFSYSRPIPSYLDENNNIRALPDETCPEPVAGSCGTFSTPDTSMTANSTHGAALNFWKTLQGFMGVFPQYSKNGFNLATESYGGHYGPVFSTFIEQQNELGVPGATKIDLKTLLVGNGWYDPMIQYQAFYNFTVSPGNTYDYFPFDAATESMLFENLYGEGMCLDQLKKCRSTGLDTDCAIADQFCMVHVEDLYADALGRDVYDVRELAPDPFPYRFFIDYLNTERVQRAIGAHTNFTAFSYPVGEAFSATGDDARDVDSLADLRGLLARGVAVALYAGDADFDCNWLGGEVVAAAVGAAAGFDRAGYADLATSDGAVHGQVRQAGAFSFTRVYDSGHMVPFYQPLAALELFERAIQGLDIASGVHRVDAAYRTEGPSASTYHEGNSTMVWEVLPADSRYDVEQNRPGRPWERPSGGDAAVTPPPGDDSRTQHPFQIMSPEADRSPLIRFVDYLVAVFFGGSMV